MTANEFCRHFKIARSTLQRFKEDGRVEVMNLGGSTRRYRVFPGTAKGSGGS
jgi:predicted site-specific integrase-resolvase